MVSANPVHIDLADYKFLIYDVYIFHGISSSIFIGNRANVKTECTPPRVPGAPPIVNWDHPPRVEVGPPSLGYQGN